MRGGERHDVRLDAGIGRRMMMQVAAVQATAHDHHPLRLGDPSQQQRG